ARAELEPPGGGGRERQRHEGIVRVLVALGQLAAPGERGAPADGDVGVLAHEERFKAAILQRPRQLGDVDAVVGREIIGTYLHAVSPAIVCRMLGHERNTQPVCLSPRTRRKGRDGRGGRGQAGAWQAKPHRDPRRPASACGRGSTGGTARPVPCPWRRTCCTCRAESSDWCTRPPRAGRNLPRCTSCSDRRRCCTRIDPCAFPCSAP